MKISLVLFSFALSWAAIGLRLRVGHRGLDQPNQRSLHEIPTPHGGGIGIVAATLVAGAWLGVAAALLAIVVCLALLSLLDDLKHLPFWLRLLVHLGAAAVVCSLLQLPAWLWLPAMLAMGWTTNLYNFMDGADGLAGSQGAVGFAAYAGAFALAGQSPLALWCASIAAACLAFLRFNWPPARIFMGDVGSIPLGFLAGSLGLLGVWRGYWPAWFPMLAFSLFLLDATVTLLRRLFAGRRVWEAHRDHYYQRMVRMGYGHRGMTVRWLGAMALAAVLAVALLQAPGNTPWLGAAGWLGILLGLGRHMDRRWAAFQGGAAT
jgi:UDP-N-acetylmuramyl pentapeptide phosphotransferase/UDP-N-acetylglucosamine-1-phosphate transferase